MKVLAHLVLVDHPPDGFPDAPGPGEGAALDPFGDVGQGGLGGRQQLVAFAGVCSIPDTQQAKRLLGRIMSLGFCRERIDSADQQSGLAAASWPVAD